MVLLFFAFFNINFHPHIIDSLLAIRIFFVLSIMSMVGCKPDIPGIAVNVTSEIELNFLISNLFIIFVLTC